MINTTPPRSVNVRVKQDLAKDNVNYMNIQNNDNPIYQELVEQALRDEMLLQEQKEIKLSIINSTIEPNTTSIQQNV